VRPFLSYAIGIAGAVSVAAALPSFVSSGSSSPAASARRGSNTIAVRAPQDHDRGQHAFYFTRGIYSDYGRRGWFGGGGGSWDVDYPKADRQFVTVLRRLTNLDAYYSEYGHAMRLDDPELRRYPFLYILEVGRISLSPGEVKGLRDYMLSGGFVFVDDFWGEQQWSVFAQQMRDVLPDHPIVEMSLDHPVFKVFYEIRELQQMPSINHWRGGRRTECPGCDYAVRGIFDEDGQLMMLINWNTDNGDAWEWAEQPDIPLKFTTYAYQLGVNAIVYAMSH
jgi:Domain of unknown function (DUF4159)